MSIQSQMEREEEAILDAEARGDISHAEAREQLRDLYADYRAAAQEAAWGAYEAEMERW